MPETPSTRQQSFADLLQRFVAAKSNDVQSFLNREGLDRVGGFGGHTSCYEAKIPGHRLIIDGGSGIKELGSELMRGPAAKGQANIHILMTHFHWDHLIGLPFFLPLFISGNQVNFYAVQEELEASIRLIFSKPYFPVEFKDLGCDVQFHRLRPRIRTEINGFNVTPYRLDHPDPCWGFAIEAQNKKVAHCVDTECTRLSREDLGEDLPLYQNVDLMVFDAQYTMLELIEKMNWGHAVAGLGIDIAMREGVKKIAFVHHDPSAGTAQILDAFLQAKLYYEQQLKESQSLNLELNPVELLFAREGLIIEL